MKLRKKWFISKTVQFLFTGIFYLAYLMLSKHQPIHLQITPDCSPCQSSFPFRERLYLISPQFCDHQADFILLTRCYVVSVPENKFRNSLCNNYTVSQDYQDLFCSFWWHAFSNMCISSLVPPKNNTWKTQLVKLTGYSNEVSEQHRTNNWYSQISWYLRQENYFTLISGQVLLAVLRWMI